MPADIIRLIVKVHQINTSRTSMTRLDHFALFIPIPQPYKVFWFPLLTMV